MSVVLGRYELTCPLATGGMAEVFLGKRRGPGGIEKQVVVKRIARAKSRDPRFAELFVAEAKLSMSMVHKNIVPVFDFGRAGDELFLVMEYIDGLDLGDALKQSREKERPLAPVLVAFIGVETAQALDYAHTRSDSDGNLLELVHHDVTPRNVLLSHTGEVKLTDFGIAGVSDGIGDARKVRGTPGYMSPEQARGDRLTPTSDIFSLGLILREALTSERVFRDADQKALLASAREPLEPLTDDEGPTELVAIINRMLEFRSEDRFASAKEVHHALDRFLIGTRAQAGEESAPPAAALTEWLEGMDKKSLAPGVQPVRGDVVTYLADGKDEALGQILPAGEATMRSMAATVASLAGVDEPDDSASASRQREPAVAAQRNRRWLIATVSACAVVAIVWATSKAASNSETKAPGADESIVTVAEPPPAPVPTIADAAVATDAGMSAKTKSLADARAASPRPVTTHRAKPDAAPSSKDTASGTVRISTMPWAAVTVVGRKESCAETPCTIELPPGSHRVRLHNPVSDVGEIVEIQVESGGTTTLQRSLTRRLSP